MGCWAPLLTEMDNSDSPEGGIDPLGLFAIADALGEKLAPGVRERQGHPRFLTAIAVSLDLCSEFDDESIASDGVSEPWQVFEWYVVEGLVRSGSDYRGMPGGRKAEAAIRVGGLSAKRYLKSPSVFGLHGVYRVLARALGLDEAARLTEAGRELLLTWEREQGLEGFTRIGSGSGQTVREQIMEAVKDGLKKGQTARSPSWSGWQFFGNHLGVRNARARECKFLAHKLRQDTAGFRGELIAGLLKGKSRAAWEREGSERSFHAALRQGTGTELRRLLAAVASYEQFSRLCQDAFDDCLFEMTRRRNKTSPRDLAALKSVKVAAKRVSESFDALAESLVHFGLSNRVRDVFGSLADRTTVSGWAERLAEHHFRTQKGKPPEGKNPWFERFDDGSFVIRPLYRRDIPASRDGSYVHAYRTEPLWSFALDLKLAKAAKP